MERRKARDAGLLALAAATALLGGFFWWGLRKARRTEAEFPPAGEFVTVEGVRLHYLRRGYGPPVVMLHGSAGFLQDYSMTVMDRVSQEHRVYAFDRPGHSYSERPVRETATPAVQARLIRDALQELGIEKPLLVGHSWGGSLILSYAVEYPEEVSGIVLLGTIAYEDDKFSEPRGLAGRRSMIAKLTKIILYPPLLPEPLKHSVARVLSGRPLEKSLERAYSPYPVPPEYLKAAKVLWPRGSMEVSQEEIAALNPSFESLSHRYGELRVPTTIVTGDSDLLVDPEKHSYPLHQAIPGSELVKLADTGHEVPHTRPEAVLDAIRDTWSQASKRP